MKPEMLLNIIVIFIFTSFVFQNDVNLKIECTVTSFSKEEQKAEIHIIISGGTTPFNVFIYDKNNAPWVKNGNPIFQINEQVNRDFTIELNNIGEGIYYVMVKDFNELVKVKKFEIKF